MSLDVSKLFVILVQLAIFSIYVTSIIEVIKNISAVGIWGLFKDLFSTLVKNNKMDSGTFPVLNFAIALLICWAFDVSVMRQLFSNMVGINIHNGWAAWIDYFGTSSVIYAGADQFFKRVLAAEKQASSVVEGIKDDQNKVLNK